MKRIVYALLLLSFFAAPGLAQEVIPWEVFGGYSFQRADAREYFISRSAPAVIYTARHHYVNMNGWEFSVTENVNRWFGGTLDISGYYKSPTIGSVTTTDHIYTILYGPRFTFPKASGNAAPARLISASVPFAHILFGGAQTSATVGPPGPHASDFSFAMAIGGGLDWPLTPNVDMRVLQLDYLRTNALATSQNNYRATAGIVLRLGKPK